LAVLVQLEIREECVEEFLRLMKANAAGSRSEPRCLRFDLLQDRGHPCKFATYEVFESMAAMDAHKEMPYVKAWGAFQYGPRKPVLNKTLLKTDAIELQTRDHRSPMRAPPITCVLQVEIAPNCVDEFTVLMQANAAGARSEMKCLHFDFLQDQESPYRFVTYEVFASEEALEMHKGKPYNKAWSAFQYDPKKPVVHKAVSKFNVIDLA